MIDHSKTPHKVLVHPANESGTALYRCVAPAAALRLSGHATTIGRMRFLTADEVKVAKPDVIVLQGQYHNDQIASIRAYRKALPGVHISYDLDDAIWHVLDSNPAAAEIPKNVKSRIKTAISLCDAVTVTTEHLAKSVRAAFKAKDVRVIPNHLTSRFINEAEAGRRSTTPTTDKKPRIGWSGSISHAEDIAFLKEVIEHFGDRVQWVFHGLMPDTFSSQVEFHEYVSLADYPKSLGSLNLDLALAPLLDNPFNQAKSNLKLLEYGACGYAVLADKVEPYIGFPHVWHAKAHTPEAWIQAIEALLQSTAGLEAIGERLSEYVKKNFRLEDHLLDWQKAWLPRNAVPFVPGTDGENRLILRDGAFASRDIQDRLEKYLANAASVSALHNEGVYPIAGQYAAVPAELATQLDEAADYAGCDPVPAPYPIGPAVLLSGTALDRIGEPNVARYGSVDAAMLDWGARAMEAGLGHVIAADTYVASSTPVQRDQDEAQRIVTEVSFWCPFFPDSVQGYGKADPLATARRNVEMSFIRREYTNDVEGELQTRMLLINPSEDDVKNAAAEVLVFTAQLDGHYLHFTFPQMPNVAPIDTRESIDNFIEVLGRLGLPHIVLFGLGDGTLGAVGFLADVAEAGWHVDAVKPETMSNHHLSEAQWQATWDRLLAHQVVTKADNA